MSNIPCVNCGYNPDVEVLKSWEFRIPVVALSGNKVGANAKGPAGYKYRNYKKTLFNKLYKKLSKQKITHQENFKRRVKLTRAYGKGKHAYDTDNLYWGFKPLVDILTDVKVLRDDSPRFCDRPKPEQVKSETGRDYILLVVEELNVKI